MKFILTKTFIVDNHFALCQNQSEVPWAELCNAKDPLTSHLVNLPKNNLSKVPLIFNKKLHIFG